MVCNVRLAGLDPALMSGLPAWIALTSRPTIWPPSSNFGSTRAWLSRWVGIACSLSSARGNVAGGKGRKIPVLLTVRVGEPLRKALAMVEQHDITQIPVLRGDEVVGTLFDNEILKRVLEDSSSLDQPVESLMGDPLPVVRSDEPVGQVTRLLASRNPAVLVSDDGTVTGILTRFDMLQFIAGGE